MHWASKLTTAWLALLLGACAAAPKETVELSDAVNQQIAQMQGSHVKFVRLYYDGLRKDVDEFMAQRWAPLFLSNVIEGKGAQSKQFRADLDRGYALANVDWTKAVRIEGIEDPKTVQAIHEAINEIAIHERGELGVVLIDFANAAQKQINLERSKLMAPIDAQEAYVLGQLTEGYTQLLAGSAAIKGYLASVVKVTENRDAVLQQLGVLDEQRRLLNSAIQVNEEVSKGLGQAQTAGDGVDAAVKKLNEWLAAHVGKTAK
jgi:hypothetical protein